MNCTIRITGPSHRRAIVLYADDGRTRLVSLRVRPGESDKAAHQRFVVRLAEHPEFGGVVAASWDDEVLERVEGL